MEASPCPTARVLIRSLVVSEPIHAPPRTMQPRAFSCCITANACSKSSTLRTPVGTRLTRNAWAASSVSCIHRALTAEVGSQSTPIRAPGGSTSRSNARILP